MWHYVVAFLLGLAAGALAKAFDRKVIGAAKGAWAYAAHYGRQAWTWMLDRLEAWAGLALLSLLMAAGCGTAQPRGEDNFRGVRQPKQMEKYAMPACDTAPSMYLALSRERYLEDNVTLVVGAYKGAPHSWVEVGGEYLLDAEHDHAPLRLENAGAYHPWSHYELVVAEDAGRQTDEVIYGVSGDYGVRYNRQRDTPDD